AAADDEPADMVARRDEDDARRRVAANGAREVRVVGKRQTPLPTRFRHHDACVGWEWLETPEVELRIAVRGQREIVHLRVVGTAQLGERGAAEYQHLHATDAVRRRRVERGDAREEPLAGARRRREQHGERDADEDAMHVRGGSNPYAPTWSADRCVPLVRL